MNECGHIGQGTQQACTSRISTKAGDQLQAAAWAKSGFASHEAHHLPSLGSPGAAEE